MTFEDSETKTEDEETEETAADQLQQLVHTFCQGAMVGFVADTADDELYMSYANIMAKSCGEEEEEGEEEEGAEAPSLQEQEVERMRLLFLQVLNTTCTVHMTISMERASIGQCQGLTIDAIYMYYFLSFGV